MRLLISAFLLLCPVLIHGQTAEKNTYVHAFEPGTLSRTGMPAFDCYRSFYKQLEMTGTFARDLGISHRCFFASNTINSLGEYYCQYPPIWVGTGKYEWANLDAQVDDLINASPNARFLCMIDLNTPYWAIRRYAMDSYDFISHFACNGRWFDETMRWLDDFVAYAERKYGDRIEAYILSGGCTSEWYEYRRGYSTAVKDQGWREWTRMKGMEYGEVAPTVDRLHKASFENRVYDPRTEQECIDYWKFHGDIIADAVLKYASHARTIIPASKQIGVFFGYYFVSDPHLISFGHMGYEKVLASPDIDFFIAPASYSSRAMGEAGGSQTMFGTAMLDGKRLLHEIDHRPHGYFMGGSSYNDAKEDIAGNLREACFAIINHADMWWFDMWSHFYDDPALREAIGRAHVIFERFKDDNSASVSEVLYLADPESMDHLNDETTFPHGLSELFRNRMGKTGMPMDCYSLSDVSRLNLSRYKVVALPATMNITPEKEDLLKRFVCKDGRTVIWCYAPGISDGRTLDPERVEEWAGVPFGTEGVSKTSMGDWTAVYSREPSSYTSDVIKQVCLDAGVHEYVEGLDPVYANERLLCVHSKDGGLKKVMLPRKAKEVRELFSGKTVAKRSSAFNYVFETPDTRLFEIIYQ